MSPKAVIGTVTVRGHTQMLAEQAMSQNLRVPGRTKRGEFQATILSQDENEGIDLAKLCHWKVPFWMGMRAHEISEYTLARAPALAGPVPSVNVSMSHALALALALASAPALLSVGSSYVVVVLGRVCRAPVAASSPPDRLSLYFSLLYYLLHRYLNSSEYVLRNTISVLPFAPRLVDPPTTPS